MAVAFSEKEKRIICQSLKNAAVQCAKTTGIKKTTVEELTTAAGISKGAFYGFYPSKELLFFDVLNEFNGVLYNVVFTKLVKDTGMSDADRATAAILVGCNFLKDSGMSSFMGNYEASFSRKIPNELEHHYHIRKSLICNIFKQAGLHTDYEDDIFAASLRGLVLKVLLEQDAGLSHPDVQQVLIRGICKELFPR